MPSLTVKPVNTRREKKQFLHLPWQIYKDSSHWIPPLRMNQKELVGFAKHPFYDDGDRQMFIALRDGQPCGRIGAIINNSHNRRYNEKRGFFGFFECVNDLEVATGLFETAKQWLREKGMTDARGPANPSMNYECGLLVDGFDLPPTFMMTYNHEYYEELILANGFSKTQDMYSFWGSIDMMETLDKKLDFVVTESIKRFDLEVRRMDRSNFDAEVRLFLDIYNQALVGTWGFAPMSEAEVAHMSQSLRRLIVPEMTTICEVQGRPIGAVFGLLDYNPRIKKINGRLFPFGFIRLLWNKRAVKKIRLISTNVIPEYQRWGVGLVLLARLVPDVLDWGVQEAEFSWVLESNNLSYGSLKRGGAKIDKVYRMYDASLQS